MREECAEVVVSINHPRLDRIFHYRVPYHLVKPLVGTLVKVPLASQTVQGWIIGYSEPPAGVEVKELISVLNPEPVFTQDLLKLARWMAEYYLYPLAGVLKIMTPPIKVKSSLKTSSAEVFLEPSRSHEIVLTREQSVVLKEIENSLRAGKAQGFFLYGVTGSGKTQVYLHAALVTVSLGRQVLYLVPEIALTPQVGAWFKAALGKSVAIWHSRLARGERYHVWEGVRQGEINIVIGPRSAVFAPFQNLGLVIVDEEHDPSYKQQERPYYHVREVASMRAFLNQAVLILGSATPSLESYTKAREGKYKLLTLTKRPGRHVLPQISLVDLQEERKRGNFSLLSRYLKKQISDRLQRGEQVILFLNRRGYAPLVFCPSCGYVLKCRNCSISLVYHQATKNLRCHYCNFKCYVPERCPLCGSLRKMSFLRTGIQYAEQLIRHLFPNACLQRLDLDAVRRKGAYTRILGSFARGEIDILLGTQMIAKGHDFPRVTLVGVLNGDVALHLPDFRAAERTYQLLTQVAGRAGRGDVPGEVVVQTYYPEHYSVWAACRQDYQYFYHEEVKNRAYFGYPPFGDLIRLRVSGERQQDVVSLTSDLAEKLRNALKDTSVSVLGPAPAPILRVKGYYRWQIMLKGNLSEARQQIREHLNQYCVKSNAVISVDVNPVGF